GEMYFYLSLADKVIIGAGFSERGAHNIIEPLSVGKPVYVGPYTWTIEFPFLEAQEAKVARSFQTPEAMQAELAKKNVVAPETLLKFVALHRGASVRTLEALNEVVRRKR
ncbi:MAG: 3-deoxy-D-manno-octulosonic acid transferase, partial [Shimia sp.]|nr:3-deoxy-D-manno-octulosonic acid transferase [Shimia sp.]